MNELIFGYTPEQIREAQKGCTITRPLPDYDPVFRSDELKSDVYLLVNISLKKLEANRYYGVIDRLARAGIIDS